jgi:hypothetical protein
MFANDKSLTLKENLDAFRIYAMKEIDHVHAISVNKYIDDSRKWVNENCPVAK